jgi:hypothetical protein
VKKLLHPEGESGPSKWHCQLSRKQYFGKWTEAINVLKLVLGNQRAEKFSIEVQNSLIESANEALDDLLKKRTIDQDNKFFQEVLRDALFQLRWIRQIPW